MRVKGKCTVLPTAAQFQRRRIAATLPYRFDLYDAGVSGAVIDTITSLGYRCMRYRTTLYFHTSLPVDIIRLATFLGRYPRDKVSGVSAQALTTFLGRHLPCGGVTDEGHAALALWHAVLADGSPIPLRHLCLLVEQGGA